METFQEMTRRVTIKYYSENGGRPKIHTMTREQLLNELIEGGRTSLIRSLNTQELMNTLESDRKADLQTRINEESEMIDMDFVSNYDRKYRDPYYWSPENFEARRTIGSEDHDANQFREMLLHEESELDPGDDGYFWSLDNLERLRKETENVLGCCVEGWSYDY